MTLALRYSGIKCYMGSFLPGHFEIKIPMSEITIFQYAPTVMTEIRSIGKGGGGVKFGAYNTRTGKKTRAPGGLTLTWIDVSYLWCT